MGARRVASQERPSFGWAEIVTGAKGKKPRGLERGIGLWHAFHADPASGRRALCGTLKDRAGEPCRPPDEDLLPGPDTQGMENVCPGCARTAILLRTGHDTGDARLGRPKRRTRAADQFN